MRSCNTWPEGNCEEAGEKRPSPPPVIMFGCCRKQKDKGIKVTPEVKTVEESPVAKRISQKSIDVEDTAATCKESTLPEPSERGSSRFVAVFRFPTFYVRSTY